MITIIVNKLVISLSRVDSIIPLGSAQFFRRVMTESVEFQDDICPVVGDGVVESLVEGLYGLRCGDVVQLNGYDDKNYRVVCSGVEYVLKIMNKVESKKVGFVEAQNEMMVFLSGRGFNCPVPLKNKNGGYYSLETLESGVHVVRLLTYLPGRIFWEVDKTDENFYELGRYVAELDSALKVWGKKRSHRRGGGICKIAAVCRISTTRRTTATRHCGCWIPYRN